MPPSRRAASPRSKPPGLGFTPKKAAPASPVPATPAAPAAPPQNLVLEIFKVVAKNFATPTVVCAAEKLLLPSLVPWLVAAGPLLGLPRAYAFVILINLVGSGFFVILLGFKVGRSRGAFAAQAKAAGDDDADARFNYPKMYAEGFSDEARGFNCVQRSHQHTLETYPTILIMSAVGGIGQPITTALAGALWIFARQKWANGYQWPGGDPKNRYEKSDGWGRHIWTSLLALCVTSTSTAAQLLL